MTPSFPVHPPWWLNTVTVIILLFHLGKSAACPTSKGRENKAPLFLGRGVGWGCGFPDGSDGKESPAMQEIRQEIQVPSLGEEESWRRKW